MHGTVAASGPRTARTLALALAAALIASLALAIPARAEDRVVWQVSGGGWGHGVGMSQYGADGFAKQGRGWVGILRHYYRGTRIGTAEPRSVRVLLQSGLSSVVFSGIGRACGILLDSSKTFQATLNDSGVVLRNFAGRRLAGCGPLLHGVPRGDAFDLHGKGTYRGRLHVRAWPGGGLSAINEVAIDGYVRGVVPREMPPTWHLNALRAQAVAARTYALATTVEGSGYDLYDDTRSQVYGGLLAETASTNRAVTDTARRVVTFGGELATTFYFSTSGGHTESVHNVWGGERLPYLTGVRDPHDGASPHHRWRLSFSDSRMQSLLGGLVPGRLVAIRAVRGRSPRIVDASLVGTRGSTRVGGATLQSRLGLRDRWATFRRVRIGGSRARERSAPRYGVWQAA